jgi:hypothetical protein
MYIYINLSVIDAVELFAALCSSLYSVYLLYWHKGTNTDACGPELFAALCSSTGVSICTFVPVKQVN